jgi:beta-lactamase superfamily II metal-dependent hydrolase
MYDDTRLDITFLPVGNGDCALLQFNAGKFNILVDAGSGANTIATKTVETLNTLLGQRKVIDIGIVTHHDYDHIGGFPLLLESDIQVEALIFNSPHLVARFLGNMSAKKVSAKHANGLAKKKKPINSFLVTSGTELKFLDETVVLNFLTPHEADIQKHGHTALTEEQNKTIKVGVKPPFATIDDLLKTKDEFKEDESKSNLLSLSFILNFMHKSWLFLGDAWPSRVLQSLEDVSPNGRHKFEFVKVSHHGSKGNTSIPLVEKIDTSNFVITASGNTHPDEEIFQRIIKGTGARSVKFYFPEETPQMTRLFTDSDLCSVYPNANTYLTFCYPPNK